MLIPRYKNLITYCIPRSGSHLLEYRLWEFLSFLSSNEYTNLGEFFNTHSIEKKYNVVGSKFYRGPTSKKNTFSHKIDYKDGIVAKWCDYSSTGKIDYDKELQRLFKLWNICQTIEHQKYFLKVFPMDFMNVNPAFIDELNGDKTLFMVLLRAEYREAVLSKYIAQHIGIWVTKKQFSPTMPEKNSVHIDLNGLDIYLSNIEDFYKSIKTLDNKTIINYADLRKFELVFDLLKRVYKNNISEYIDTEVLKTLDDDILKRGMLLPTPYTMDRIDYIENKNEVLKKFKEFDDINNHYMDLYGIK